MFKDWQFQTYWKRWYSLPWWNVHERGEYGPKEIWFGVGPFQFRKIIWRRK